MPRPRKPGALTGAEHAKADHQLFPVGTVVVEDIETRNHWRTTHVRA